jgi:hypothetical protein
MRLSWKRCDHGAGMQRHSEDHATWKARLLRRLAVVVDDGQTYMVRIAAIRAVQEMFDVDSSIRCEDAHSLLDRVLNSWDTREELRGGRYAECRVKRPPEGLRDVWKW